MYIILLLDAGLVAYFFVISALFPGRVSLAHAIANRMPGRAFALGLVNFLFFAAIVFVLLSLADRVGGLVKIILTVPALVITVLFFIALSFGLPGIASLVGERVFPDHNPWRRLAAGVLLLGIGSAVPLVGWFLLLPYIGFSAIGAVILTFFQKDTL